MMDSENSAFARLYLPADNGCREFLSFHFDAALDAFRSGGGDILRIHPWSDSQDFLCPQSATHHKQFADAVLRSIDALKTSKLKKVVLSRLCGIEHQGNQSEDVFTRLAQGHQNALVYHLRHPRYGEWIGATPELLFSREGLELKTMALAGTLPVEAPSMWSKKLLEEHEFVVQDVLAAFQQLRAEHIKREGPHDLVAGAVKHLKTSFAFQTAASNDDLRMVLHPTSAICGFPRNLAARWIAENESHERRLYCGLLGIERKHNSFYFVNLRCAQILGNRIELFAGVGLTAQSIVEDEWKETERKLDTIRKQFE